MNQTVHVAITRTVKQGCEASFEKAVLNFFAQAQENESTLGAQLLRPLPGSQSRNYGILRSFGSEKEREALYQSEQFLRWQDEVAPFVEGDYSRRELNGLEAFFRGANPYPGATALENGCRYLVGRVADSFCRIVNRRTVAAIRLAFLAGRGNRDLGSCGYLDLGRDARIDSLDDAMAEAAFNQCPIERNRS